VYCHSLRMSQKGHVTHWLKGNTDTVDHSEDLLQLDQSKADWIPEKM
jgi:hypothetical protein